MDELISIIVPVYNVEKYLPKCIESLLKQTYKKLEIILVDDGSTDQSGIICTSYEKLDRRIKVIHKQNGGLSDARNFGLNVAKGKYVTLVDSDDFVEPIMIEYLYTLISKYQADISVCQRNEVEEKNNVIHPHLTVQEEVVDGNRNCMKSFFTNKGIDTVACGKLYKNELFDKVRYPIGKYHEDVFTTYKLIAQAQRIAIGSEHLYNYLIRSNSISNSSFQMKHLDAIEANKQRSSFIKERYPECLVYANAGIVYATNSCILKMINSKIYKSDILTDLQRNYRSYEYDFLRGKSSLKAKIFSVFGWINLPLFVRVLMCLKKDEAKYGEANS